MSDTISISDIIKNKWLERRKTVTILIENDFIDSYERFTTWTIQSLFQWVIGITK